MVQYTYVCIYRHKSCSVFSQSPAFQGLGAADRDLLEIGSTQLRRDVGYLWEIGEGRVPLNPLVKWLFEGQYIHLLYHHYPVFYWYTPSKSWYIHWLITITSFSDTAICFMAFPRIFSWVKVWNVIRFLMGFLMEIWMNIPWKYL